MRAKCKNTPKITDITRKEQQFPFKGEFILKKQIKVFTQTDSYRMIKNRTK
jgi:hypothetical protein